MSIWTASHKPYTAVTIQRNTLTTGGCGTLHTDLAMVHLDTRESSSAPGVLMSSNLNKTRLYVICKTELNIDWRTDRLRRIFKKCDYAFAVCPNCRRSLWSMSTRLNKHTRRWNFGAMVLYMTILLWSVTLSYALVLSHFSFLIAHIPPFLSFFASFHSLLRYSADIMCWSLTLNLTASGCKVQNDRPAQFDLS